MPRTLSAFAVATLYAHLIAHCVICMAKRILNIFAMFHVKHLSVHIIDGLLFHVKHHRHSSSMSSNVIVSRETWVKPPKTFVFGGFNEVLASLRVSLSQLFIIGSGHIIFFDCFEYVANSIQIVAVIIVNIYATFFIVPERGNFCRKSALHSGNHIL